MGILPVSAHILNPVWKLQLFRKWDKWIDINPVEETFYTTQYQEAILQHMENKYYAKHGCVLLNKSKSVWSNNLVTYALA